MTENKEFEKYAQTELRRLDGINSIRYAIVHWKDNNDGFLSHVVEPEIHFERYHLMVRNVLNDKIKPEDFGIVAITSKEEADKRLYERAKKIALELSAQHNSSFFDSTNRAEE